MSTHQLLLDRYELQQRLAQTTIDEDWKAFDTQLRRYIALKILHIGQNAPPDMLMHFSQTIKNVVALHHPNIVPLLDYQNIAATDGTIHDIYAISQYVEGGSLAAYLSAASYKGAFPSAQELVLLLSSIAAGLGYAHQHGVVHGALKPESILFDKQHAAAFSWGLPRITHFTLQSLYPLLSLPLQAVYYVSPEVAQGYTGTERSDIYSLGVILYELCTGVLPFQGETADNVMMQHIHAVPTPPMLINPNLLPAVTSVIMRCLAKDPAIRFSSAHAIVAALAKGLNVALPAPEISSPSISLTSLTPDQPASDTNLSADPADSMNSPTYLSIPQTPMMQPVSQAHTNNAFPPSMPSVPLTPKLRMSESFPLPIIAPTMPTPRQVAQTPVVQALPAQSPAQAPPPVFSSPPPPKRPFWRQRAVYISLIALVLIGLLGSAFWAYFTFGRSGSTATAGSPIIGHAFFISSGLINLTSSQGIADGVQLEMDNLPPAPSGKLYYAWLLSDNDTNMSILPILLDALPASGGHVQFTYTGDAQHSDLLVNYSRLLVTEESANPPPTNPSLDPSTWQYYSAFSQTPNPQDTLDHFSLLNHLRHLLAQDPMLKTAGLIGGLDIWLFRNTEKILEAAGSARDTQQAGGGSLVYRQIVRVLDYLDGSKYVGTEKLRPGTPLLIDPTIANVAILEFDLQNQTPPGYLKHIGNHLRNIINCPGITPEQRNLAIQINAAIDNVNALLLTVHSDAEQLVQMSDSQLAQPAAATLLNDLFVHANAAFAGQIDPNTNQVKAGVVQIHYNIQRLATFDIAACTSSNSTNPCK